jgi:hypothetical protein
MKLKQAAALLTNNNQYLITFCIKGAKGHNYDPVIAWYNLLCEHVDTICDMLYFENKQLNKTASKTFIKVMTLLGSGFYSQNSEVVSKTFRLFQGIFADLMPDPDMAIPANKWFLMN